MYHFKDCLEQSLTAYIWTYILYQNNNNNNNKKPTKFVDRVDQKIKTNPKLGQDRKSRSTEKKT